ncbi:DUF1345 domain-containing protein [Chelatococcus reniformis]|uniref:Membrane protein n=1 Tax=Chelatococcus reniformis TaxID=1494448 RepID=A0A916UC91_9HYPH|nr:DUF1345 domain-containing protein [Chelatococcus reniformis]GGC66951.1 membrane protein [Chelatococcus reniformis]
MRTRIRTTIALAVMVATFLLTGGLFDLLATRVLVAWNAGAILWLVLAFQMMATSNVSRMRQRAVKEDEGAGVILVVCCAAALTSIVAIGFVLSAAAGKTPEAHAFALALAGCTILTSWFFVHTAFTLHYAHEYYNDDGQVGLAFPGVNARPDYWDFAYFAVNIGAASQTSDVQITSAQIRRLVLAHSVLAFFFNTTILAFAINVGAGLL